MFSRFPTTIIVLLVTSAAFADTPPLPFVELGTYEQEVCARYGVEQGLPDLDVRAIAVTPMGTVYAATAKGLAWMGVSRDGWKAVSGLGELTIVALAAQDETVYAASEYAIHTITDGIATALATRTEELNPGVPRPPLRSLYFTPGSPAVRAASAWALYDVSKDGITGSWHATAKELGDGRPQINQVAAGETETVLAMQQGLIALGKDSATLARLYPADGTRSWAPVDVRGAVYDSSGNLWFACPQGVGVRRATAWELYTPEDGLPYDDFTCVAAGPNGIVWFGTKQGAISFDGEHWGYRQANRWLPGNEVRAIAVDTKGAAWFATDNGVGVIERVPMSFKEKAKRFEDQIDKYHRRTPYEFVLSVSLDKPGDPDGGFKQHDSDNDGLWTSMYGAGECFAYAATGDPKAKARAKKAFDAMHFLGKVTQGGELSPPKGFVARSIMPTDGPDPNAGRDDAKKQRDEDALWKTHVPWWPKSKDGKWYWKSDTSSDELDGHYFFYAAYYDLVADTDEEKARVREHVLALTDHLIEHDFDLVDYDGKPTRWARYSPKNWDDVAGWWAGRGLNSLSIISYLRVAQHISGGDKKYADAYEYLVKEHQYAANIMVPKWQLCPGCGNQSDDEMGFMSFYNLMKYETDPQRKQDFAFAFYNYWMIEEPELNPLFNFLYASQCWGLRHVNPFGSTELTPNGPWLEDSIDTLKRYPVDRIEWGVKNRHRKDIVPLRRHTREGNGSRGRGHRASGYVLPIDEREVEHWNVDPWELDYSGGGSTLMDPQSFLLPYYMGLYHGFIVEK